MTERSKANVKAGGLIVLCTEKKLPSLRNILAQLSKRRVPVDECPVLVFPRSFRKNLRPEIHLRYCDKLIAEETICVHKFVVHC